MTTEREDPAYAQEVRNTVKYIQCLCVRRMLFLFKCGDFELSDEIIVQFFSDDDIDDADDELDQHNELENVDEPENHNPEEEIVSTSEDDDDDDASEDNEVQHMDVNVVEVKKKTLLA